MIEDASITQYTYITNTNSVSGPGCIYAHEILCNEKYVFNDNYFGDYKIDKEYYELTEVKSYMFSKIKYIYGSSFMYLDQETNNYIPKRLNISDPHHQYVFKSLYKEWHKSFEPPSEKNQGGKIYAECLSHFENNIQHFS